MKKKKNLPELPILVEPPPDLPPLSIYFTKSWGYYQRKYGITDEERGLKKESNLTYLEERKLRKFYDLVKIPDIIRHDPYLDYPLQNLQQYKMLYDFYLDVVRNRLKPGDIVKIHSTYFIKPKDGYYGFNQFSIYDKNGNWIDEATQWFTEPLVFEKRERITQKERGLVPPKKKKKKGRRR